MDVCVEICLIKIMSLSINVSVSVETQPGPWSSVVQTLCLRIVSEVVTYV